MNHKRGRAKNQRAGCLLCKPHKANGAKPSWQEKALDAALAAEVTSEWWLWVQDDEEVMAEIARDPSQSEAA